jgi:hypothetical protein
LELELRPSVPLFPRLRQIYTALARVMLFVVHLISHDANLYGVR